MNELERKLYLKYRNMENMTQLLCLKLYRLRLSIVVLRSSGPENKKGTPTQRSLRALPENCSGYEVFLN